MSWRAKLYRIRGLIWLIEVVAATLTAVYFLLGIPKYSFCWFAVFLIARLLLEISRNTR